MWKISFQKAESLSLLNHCNNSPGASISALIGYVYFNKVQLLQNLIESPLCAGSSLRHRESAAKKTNHTSGAYCLENGKRKQTIHKFLTVLLSIMKSEQHKNGIEGRHLTCAGQRVSPRCGSVVIHPLTQHLRNVGSISCVTGGTPRWSIPNMTRSIPSSRSFPFQLSPTSILWLLLGLQALSLLS